VLSLAGLGYRSTFCAVTHNRQRRRWHSRTYYASLMRLKEFYKENAGRTFREILSQAFKKSGKRAK